MKTKYFLVILMAVVVGFAACGGGDDDESSECRITSFKTSDDKTWTINDATGTISTSFGKGEETTLTATITISDKATISPTDAATTPKDYSKAVTYTVTAENGTQKVYTVKGAGGI